MGNNYFFIPSLSFLNLSLALPSLTLPCSFGMFHLMRGGGLTSITSLHFDFDCTSLRPSLSFFHLSISLFSVSILFYFAFLFNFHQRTRGQVETHTSITFLEPREASWVGLVIQFPSLSILFLIHSISLSLPPSSSSCSRKEIGKKKDEVRGEEDDDGEMELQSVCSCEAQTTNHNS